MVLHHKTVYICCRINLTVQHLDMPVNQVYTLDHEFPVGILARRPLQQKCKCIQVWGQDGQQVGQGSSIYMHQTNQFAQFDTSSSNHCLPQK